MAWNVTLELDDRRGEHGKQVQTFQTKQVDDDKHVLTFGRSSLADITLPRGNVSKVHCWMIVNDAGFAWIRDTGATNGTWVNGGKIGDTARFGLDDRLYLGDFVIRLVEMPRPAEMTWKIALRVASRGGGGGEVRVFHRNDVILGRDKRADLHIPNGNISRRHCMFRVDGEGRVWAIDLGSTNGMHINGMRYDRTIFKVGDRLITGDHVITLAEPPKRVPA